MFGNKSYQVLDLQEDLEIEGSYEGLEMKCPRCNRKKPLSFFLENSCECGLEFEFKVKAIPPGEDEEGGIL